MQCVLTLFLATGAVAGAPAAAAAAEEDAAGVSGTVAALPDDPERGAVGAVLGLEAAAAADGSVLAAAADAAAAAGFTEVLGGMVVCTQSGTGKQRQQSEYTAENAMKCELSQSNREKIVRNGCVVAEISVSA